MIDEGELTVRTDMTAPQLLVGGEPVGFERVWVHLKQEAYSPMPYIASIPLRLAGVLFDPQGNRPNSVTLSEFLRSTADEFGSFVLDPFVNALREHTTPKPRRVEWVIASLDEVREDESTLYLIGRAERYEPARYAN